MPFVKPNVDLIVELIAMHPWSASKIFGAAGMEASTRTLNNWKKGRLADEDSLRELAKVLTRSFSDFVLEDPQEPIMPHGVTRELRWRKYILKMIETDAFRNAEAENGGLGKTEILNFAYGPCRETIRAFGLNLMEEETQLFELYRRGILRHEKTEAGKHAFYVQPWSFEETKEAYDVRVETDIADAKRAILLKVKNPDLYREIQSILSKRVEDLRAETNLLLDRPSIANSIPVVRTDCDCHLAFTHRSNIRIQRAELIIGKHLRPFHHLVYLHQTIAERNIELPRSIPSVPEMVSGFLADWTLISNGFELVDPSDKVALEKWLEIVAAHPKNNFNLIKECRDLIERHRA